MSISYAALVPGAITTAIAALAAITSARYAFQRGRATQVPRLVLQDITRQSDSERAVAAETAAGELSRLLEDGRARLESERSLRQEAEECGRAALKREQELLGRLGEADEKIAAEREALREAERMRHERLGLHARLASMSDDLAGQIMVALAETGQAVEAAQEAFSRIAEDARSATDIAREAVGGTADHGVSNIASKATGVMGLFIEGMLLSARKIATLSRELQNLVQVSADLTDLLDAIEDVAERTALIALNASIEAARAGEGGRAFGVVAAEIRKLSERSRDTAERMRALSERAMTGSESIYLQLAQTAETSLESSCEAQLEVNHLLGLLQNADIKTQMVLSALTGRGESIATNYTQIVMAFQFHDMLRQRLEHAADPLFALRDELDSDSVDGAPQLRRMAGEPDPPNPPRTRVLATRAVGMPPPLKVVTYAPTDDDNVTLF